MEFLSRLDESFPTPPPYFLPGKIPAHHVWFAEPEIISCHSLKKKKLILSIFLDESQTGQDVRIYHIHSPFSPPRSPPSFFSPGNASALPASNPRLKFVSYETELYHSPALTTCPSCQTQVTTQVDYQVGRHAWLMCLVFVLCGLVFGCCLIPFFVKHFKDAYHTCPHCRRVLHVHRRTCCE
uniref:Lipopolysaccharide-induced tumor necrosis factor-alpha factor homolog n=1 Tax=Seriola lalandi dorsalis TaxID=1841481 RepID=A0A3B4Z209_SERLL